MNIYQLLIDVPWCILFGYWGLSALKLKQVERAEAGHSRLLHITLICSAFALVLVDWLRIGPLGARFLPDSQLVTITGILIEALGVSTAVWARYHLGQYWSGTITIKQDHKLIRTGPYRVVRHPIYTGFTVTMIGSAIAIGEWRGVLAVTLMILAYMRKINLEERFLNEQFGSEYEQYRREVRALLPLVL